MERVFPPRDQWKPYVFVRAEGFYVIDLPGDEDVAENAHCNPGTLRVEDMHGRVLWTKGAAS